MRSSPIYRERAKRHTKELMDEGYSYNAITEGYRYPYTKEMIPLIKEDIKDYKKEAKRHGEVPYHREWYTNNNLRKVIRLEKLSDLIQLGLTVELHGQANFGLVMVNEIHVVNLIDWDWKGIPKEEWNNKEILNEINT